MRSECLSNLFVIMCFSHSMSIFSLRFFIKEEDMTKEMQLLRQMLEENGIPYGDNSQGEPLPMTRTYFSYNGNQYSVIHGNGSYGGWDSFNQKDKGLLEMMVNKDGNPIGYLKAEEIMKFVKGVITREELISDAVKFVAVELRRENIQ